jgi:hypothetical protein
MSGNDVLEKRGCIFYFPILSFSLLTLIYSFFPLSLLYFSRFPCFALAPNYLFFLSLFSPLRFLPFSFLSPLRFFFYFSLLLLTVCFFFTFTFSSFFFLFTFHISFFLLFPLPLSPLHFINFRLLLFISFSSFLPFFLSCHKSQQFYCLMYIVYARCRTGRKSTCCRLRFNENLQACTDLRRRSQNHRLYANRDISAESQEMLKTFTLEDFQGCMES